MRGGDIGRLTEETGVERTDGSSFGAKFVRSQRCFFTLTLQQLMSVFNDLLSTAGYVAF